MYNKKLDTIPAMIAEVHHFDKGTEQESILIIMVANLEGWTIKCLGMREHLDSFMEEFMEKLGFPIDPDLTLDENFKKVEGTMVFASNFRLTTVSLATDKNHEFDFVDFYHRHNLTQQEEAITTNGLKEEEILRKL